MWEFGIEEKHWKEVTRGPQPAWWFLGFLPCGSKERGSRSTRKSGWPHPGSRIPSIQRASSQMRSPIDWAPVEVLPALGWAAASGEHSTKQGVCVVGEMSYGCWRRSVSGAALTDPFRKAAAVMDSPLGLSCWVIKPLS